MPGSLVHLVLSTLALSLIQLYLTGVLTVRFLPSFGQDYPRIAHVHDAGDAGVRANATQLFPATCNEHRAASVFKIHLSFRSNDE